MEKKKPKIALFVESHEGYGHFNIASQLIKQLEAQGAEVMLLSGTLNYAGAAQTFNFHNARVVHLPLVDYRLLKNEKWEYVTPSETAYADDHAYIDARQNAVKAALADFKPDAVITEFFPFQQTFRKLDIEAIAELKQAGAIHPKMITLCRDIVHNNKPQEVMDLLDRHYDQILIRGDSKFATLAQSQPEWAQIKTPTDYVGNFITSMPKRNNEPDEDRHVVVFGGGGYYEKDLPFFESIIRSRKYSANFNSRFWDIYLSENANKHYVQDPRDPNQQITVFAYLEQLAAQEGQGMIRIFAPIDSKKFRHELADAAVAITRGGYNTTFELFDARTPQLVVPRDDREQIQRANALYLNGIAQVYPAHPIPEQHYQEAMSAALADPSKLATAIDRTPTISATVPPLNNHGAENTAKRVISLLPHKEPLNLLVLYQDQKHKRHDSQAITEALKANGHHVTLLDAQETEILRREDGIHLISHGQDYPLSSFDAATLRTPVEITATRDLASALKQASVPVYQDYTSLIDAHDKLRSQKVFEENQVPTPKTFGLFHNQVPRREEVDKFLTSLDHGPYVVKSNMGWNGDQVKIVDSKEEAVQAFLDFHAQSRGAKTGGALIQEFIESDPARRRDYRVQVVVGVDNEGHNTAKVVAAAQRRAQPGMRITNVSQGADMLRVALDEQDVARFYVEKQGMSARELQAKRESGEIEILPDAVRDAAQQAALAFGPGCTGVDVIRNTDGTARVLEINPFAGLVRRSEEEHGFSIYKPWAEAFVEFAMHKQRANNKDKWVSRAHETPQAIGSLAA